MTTTANWTDPELALTLKAASCFRAPMARIRLEVGTRIYRLRTNREEKKAGETQVVGASILKTWRGRDYDPGSPWWFGARTFDAIIRAAGQAGGDITAAGRAGLAVPVHYNTDFDTLVICRLLRNGYAWSGPAAPQPQSEDGPLMLPGGLDQLWIPGIKETEVRFEYFGSVRDRM